MMQILELVIYSNDNRRRQLKFKTGRVNIITGKSKSGKSAVGDIIDYCLGSTDCNIADGIVREYVSWYALLLQFENERVFIARENPVAHKQTTSNCYIEMGKDIESHEIVDFSSNIPANSIVEILSKKEGIDENIHIPPEGQTRSPLTANIKHALIYCFQSQYEIAAKDFLFHKQALPFVPQAIKDTLPYFLGAVEQDVLLLENERKEKKREYTKTLRALSDEMDIRGRSTARGFSLLMEAIRVGLVSDNKIDETDFNSIYSCLKKIEYAPDFFIEGDSNRLADLQVQYRKLTEDLSILSSKIQEAKEYQKYAQEYDDEVRYQKKRLESIGLFEKLNFQTDKCPFCSSVLNTPLPGVNEIKASIQKLDQAINQITRERPNVQKYIAELELEMETIRDKRKAVNTAIQAIFENDNRLKKIRDMNFEKAMVYGRISLWLESVVLDKDNSITKDKLKKLDERIKELDALLDQDNREERVQSALSIMQTDMTEWASVLELEGHGFPFRIDIEKITVVMDKKRPISLQQMGSGSNWVGVHLIAMIALHKFFINNTRPVPSFLFLDQPSQVYFPSKDHELNHDNMDEEAVKKIYDFIADIVEKMDGKLQIIIVDHANMQDLTSFKKNVIESWWDKDKNLVPLDWIKEQDIPDA